MSAYPGYFTLCIGIKMETISYNTIWLIAFLCFVLRFFANKFTTGLVNIPGPPLTGFSRLWRLWDVYTGQIMVSGSTHRMSFVTDNFEFEVSGSMPYLQACIKESLRLHPAVAMCLERYVPRGGVTICGKHLPEGTVVGTNTWVAGRDTETYGPDASDFRPERWLGADTEQLRLMKRNFLAFGAGSRICIGRHISLMDLSKMIPRLFRRFDICLADPQSPLQIETYWFAVQQGLHCRITPRVIQ